jgi:hypothetical protein
MSTNMDILQIWKNRKIPPKLFNCLKYISKLIARIIIIYFICRYILFIPKHLIA